MTNRDINLDKHIGKYGFALNDQEYELVKETWQASAEHSEARIAKLQAELAEAKRLLSDARRDVRYASDISELSAITLAHIDEFLNKKK